MSNYQPLVIVVMLPLMLCQVNTGDGSYTIIQQQQQQQQQQQPQPQPQQQGEQPDLPVSCVIKFNQLYCGEPGASYPTAGINKYVDDNKALLRRMFGELQERRTVTQTSVTIVTSFSQTSFVAAPFGEFQTAANAPTAPAFQRVKREVLEGTWEEMVDLEDEVEYAKNGTVKRQASDFPDLDLDKDSSKSDVCESEAEILQPFWASNSNGKIRAILNNKQFEQAIHQEVCSGQATPRCSRDCSCEQKYKWHRLLAYDPNNDCAGVFMDWFLFPSCCVCRCSNNPFLTGR